MYKIDQFRKRSTWLKNISNFKGSKATSNQGCGSGWKQLFPTGSASNKKLQLPLLSCLALIYAQITR